MASRFRPLTMGLGLAVFNVGIAPLRHDPRKNGVGGSFVCDVHHSKVEQRWWCEEGQHYVSRVGKDGKLTHHPISGYAFGEGYVVIPDEDLNRIVVPREDSLLFDRWDDHLDPIWVEKTYLARPSDEASWVTYTAIAAAMEQHRFVLFGEAALNKTTHLLALRWSPDLELIVLHQLFLTSHMKLDEAKTISSGMLGRKGPTKAVIGEVRRVVNAVLERGVEHELPDHAREKLMEVVTELATGGMISEAHTQRPAKQEPATDLMAALRASVEEAASAHAKDRARARAKRAPAKRTPAKRSGSTTASRKSARKGG